MVVEIKFGCDLPIFAPHCNEWSDIVGCTRIGYCNHKVFKCNELCIHYLNKDCMTEDEVNELCDWTEHYKEIGDVIDEALDRASERFYGNE